MKVINKRHDDDIRPTVQAFQLALITFLRLDISTGKFLGEGTRRNFDFELILVCQCLVKSGSIAMAIIAERQDPDLTVL